MGDANTASLVALPGGRDDHASGRRPPCEPVAFDGCLGLIHRPAPDAARGLAVVICAPVGRDARAAYRPLWLLAETLAEHGFAVLRYDHIGTGDSAPLDPQADQWKRWREGVEAAAVVARTYTGCQGVALLGLRIGASLAAAAAPSVGADGLVLLAPVASGGPWLRELQFAASMLRPTSSRRLAGEGALEADGVCFSAAAVKSLQRFDLKRLSFGERPIFLSTVDKTDQLMGKLGLNVVGAPFEGYDALFKDSHINAAPRALYERVAAWLETLPAAAAQPAPAPPVPPAVIASDGWVERPVSFGDGLRGVLCAPAAAPTGRGVIMANTGGDPRAGIGSFNAQASRALASRGVAALRFDFAGLGESDSVAGGDWLSHVYETPRGAEYEAAAAVMAQHGCRDLILSGVCSGGYHALRTAVADDRYRGVLVMNAAKLVWRVGETLEIVYDEDHRSSRTFLRALAKPKAWAKLLDGDIDLGNILRTLTKRLLRRWSFRLHAPETTALQDGVASLSARGVPVKVVVGREDRALDELELHFGRNGRRLGRLPGVQVEVIPGLDHGLFFPESQAKALDLVLGFVEACSARSEPDAGRRRERKAKPARNLSAAAG